MNEADTTHRNACEWRNSEAADGGDRSGRQSVSTGFRTRECDAIDNEHTQPQTTPVIGRSASGRSRPYDNDVVHD